MILSEVRNEKREQKLIVGCNIFNNKEMKSVTIPGMDYTVNIDFDVLTMGYVENIIARSDVYNEKIVVIVNIEDKGDVIDAGRKIFKLTNSVCINRLISRSTLAVYDNNLIKDIHREFNR